MNCDRTEKVSLLVDRELAPAEALEVEEHLEKCADCLRAREDFLLFREQLCSYRAELSPSAHRQALASILASRAGATKTGARAGDLEGGHRRAPLRSRGLRERVAGAFAASRLAPAALAALALVLMAAAVGLINYRSARRAEQAVAHHPAAGTGARRQNHAASQQQQQQTPGGPEQGGTVVAGSTPSGPPPQDVGPRTGGGKRSAAATVDRQPGMRLGRQGAPAPRVGRSAGARRQEAAAPANDGRSTPRAEAEAVAAAAPAEEAPGRARARGAEGPAALHLEQAQTLLRSFRNARLTDGGGGDAEIAFERERSKRLLFRNIVLRREAARKGDAPVEEVLDTLEPILIDIANLPDKPAGEDVRSIRERMRKKNIVAMLRISMASN